MGDTTEIFGLLPGSVVVFEGLDNTGKSTQLELLKERATRGGTVFAHMPSGLTPFTRGIYDLLESEPPADPLALQLAHLACHRESMQVLASAAQSGGLVLDRWWWSTWAYGWHGGRIGDFGIDERTFRDIIDSIWAPIHASVVFLFLSPVLDDPRNLDGVTEGYRMLATAHPGEAIIVPEGSDSDVHSFVVSALANAGLVVH